MELQVNQVVRGEVTGIKAYGAFVRLPNGEIGMVHISEIAQSYVKDISQYMMIGQEVTVKIIAQNQEGKFNLSIKQVTKPEEDAALYATQVEEFKKALAEKEPPKEIQDEIIRDLTPKKEIRPSQETLIAWLNAAKKQMNEQDRHRQWRQRFYEADWQQFETKSAAPGARQGQHEDEEQE
jgi:predicted RNA-binding protein with RPS1 domain